MVTRIQPSKSNIIRAGSPGKPTITAIAAFVLALMLLIHTSNSRAAATWLSPGRAIPPGYSSEILQVKFREGTNIDPPDLALPAELRSQVIRFVPIFSLPKPALTEIKARGEANIRAGKTAGAGSRPVSVLPDLSFWFQIILKPGTDAGTFIEHLKSLDNVETVEPAPLPAPPPAVTPDFTGNQGYLNVAPGGIDAAFSWLVPGGNGSGVTVYDVEYNWLQTHEDLTKASGVAVLVSSGDSNSPPGYTNPVCPAPCDSINREHGTAVLGEIIADNDTKGVTGISWGANIGLAPANTTNLGYNPANAILLAVADGNAGDVILIEQQIGVCGLTGSNLGPLEWVSTVFDAIQTAVANGFVVVEAAGNGGVDLDQSACGTTFDRTVRDSGAIIVGAGGSGGSTLDRQRLAFSTYGSRVDVQGWGDSVMTTGYGTSYTNVDDPTNPIYWYTNNFGGTSSASPIVTGAAANLQGVAMQRFGTPLTAFQVRALLVQTGSPQLGSTAQHIGPRPDLRAAINQLTEGTLDVYFLIDNSGSMGDDIAAVKSSAQSVITTLQISNPDTQFGLGKFEDYPIDPFGIAALGDKAYERIIDITANTANVLGAVNGLNPVSGAGGDDPQSQLAALLQAASGAGQDLSGVGYPGASIPMGQQANFRGTSGVTKLILLYTDAPFHLPGDPGSIPYPGPSFIETVNAILAVDPPKVIGISSGGGGFSDLQAMAAATNAFAPPGGVDCNADGTIDIPEGEPLVCMIAASGEGIGEAIVAIVEAALPTIVDVDIKPDIDFPNSVKCTNTKEVISVAILTTVTFDATSVDHTTVTFEGASEIHRDKKTGAPIRHQEDADGDGDIDLVFHFRLGDTTLTCGSTLGTLVGETFDGLEIKGIDSISMVP